MHLYDQENILHTCTAQQDQGILVSLVLRLKLLPSFSHGVLSLQKVSFKPLTKCLSYSQW